MPTAIATVLCTPSLLESILLQLPLPDLLRDQRVSRHWQNAIGSPAVQKALFFCPATDNEHAPHLNSLLIKAFPFWFVDGYNGWNSEDQNKWGNEFGNDDHSVWGHKLNNLDLASSPSRTAAYMAADASWRRMLVVQPPVKHLGVTRETHVMSSTTRRQATVSAGEGLRMGMLWDLAAEFVEGESNIFAVQWHMFPRYFIEGGRETRATRIGKGRAKMLELKNEVTLVLKDLPGRRISRAGRTPVHKFASQGYEHIKVEYREPIIRKE